MSDVKPDKLTNQATIPFQQSASVQTVEAAPVVFADGVVNQVTGAGISKFHLYRTDAIVGESDSYRKVEVVQVIMPAHGFADMVAFFEHRLKVMVKNNHISQELIDERRAFYKTYEV